MKKTFISSFILCIFLAVLSFNTSAQEYKYDLNKYYTPDIFRNKLNLNFNSLGSFSNQLYKRDTLNINTQNSNILYGTLGSSFQSYKNTRKKVSYLDMNLNLQGQFNNSDNKPNYDSSPIGNSSNSNESFNLGYMSNFYNSTNQFLSVGITTRINSATSNFREVHINVVNTSANSSINAGITPAVGIGIGRIESVKDARQAIYILDDLSKRGALSRHLSDDEIFKFSQLISQVKNKRFLDARLHKIDEITSVDSFLVNNSLLAQSDAGYFTTLYDNWENGANFERNSGQIFEIVLSPSADWFNKDGQSDVSNPVANYWAKQNNYNYRAVLSFNYNYAKQMNLNWEKTFDISLSGATGYFSDKLLSNIGNGETISTYNNHSISIQGNYSIGYYPNSRTNLSAGLYQHLLQNFNRGISDNSSYNYFFSQTILRFSAVYYVSPQLSLSGNASIGNIYEQNAFSSDNINTNNNNLGANFAATLKYSFF